jgi:hypothetical protein
VVDDLAILPGTDNIVAVGDFGLIVLSENGSTEVWQESISYTSSGLASGDAAEYSNGRRVDVGADGTIAATFNETYYIRSSSGSAISERIISREDNNKSANEDGVGGYNHRVEDVAIDSSTNRVFITGFSQRSSSFQSGYIVAFDYSTDGEDGLDARIWMDYNWWASAANNTNLGSDTRGIRIDLGEDGNLHFVGSADG